MGQRFLLDTNIAIHFRADKLPPNALKMVGTALEADECSLSVISKMEMLGWNFADAEEELKAIQFIRGLTLLRLSDEIVDKTIEIRKVHPKTKLPDAIIAATALINSLKLLTRNTGDFSKMDGLEIVNPFDL